jgi:uncharacterized protein involved in cysteine biosynthesis
VSRARWFGIVAAVADPGFFFGARTMFSALRRVARAPAYWPYLLVPSLVLSVLSALSVFVTLKFAHPMLERELLGVTSIAWLDQALVWLGVLGVSIGAIVVALLVTTPLSSPALERLVARTETELGAPPRESLGFLTEMVCGLRAQAAPLLWTLPAWIVLLVVDALAPFLSPVTFALRAALAALGVAWTLVDYPLTLRGVRVRERLALFRRAPRAVVGLGGAFALLFCVPCCGIVFLGVGVVAATELVLALAAKDPVLHAQLGPRPRSA